MVGGFSLFLPARRPFMGARTEREFPQIKIPQIKIPQIKIPQIKIPQIKIRSESHYTWGKRRVYLRGLDTETHTTRKFR
jgi:hypothetical protein